MITFTQVNGCLWLSSRASTIRECDVIQGDITAIVCSSHTLENNLEKKMVMMLSYITDRFKAQWWTSIKPLCQQDIDCVYKHSAQRNARTSMGWHKSYFANYKQWSMFRYLVFAYACYGNRSILPNNALVTRLCKQHGFDSSLWVLDIDVQGSHGKAVHGIEKAHAASTGVAQWRTDQSRGLTIARLPRGLHVNIRA